MKTLSETEAKVAVAILKQASEYFSRNMCNDFDLSVVIPDVNERNAFVKAMYEANGDPENFQENVNYQYRPDWWLAAYLANLLK